MSFAVSQVQVLKLHLVMLQSCKLKWSFPNPVDTRRRFNVFKTSYRRWNYVVCLLRSYLQSMRIIFKISFLSRNGFFGSGKNWKLFELFCLFSWVVVLWLVGLLYQSRTFFKPSHIKTTQWTTPSWSKIFIIFKTTWQFHKELFSSVQKSLVHRLVSYHIYNLRYWSDILYVCRKSSTYDEVMFFNIFF